MKLKLKEFITAIDAVDQKIYAAFLTIVMIIVGTVALVAIPQTAPVLGHGVVILIAIDILLYMLWMVRQVQTPMHDNDAIMAQLGEISEQIRSLQ